MKVFLTGGTGFVGGALACALTRAGHQVIGLIRPNRGRPAPPPAGVTWVEGDVTRPESLRGCLDGCDWLVHAAGRLGAFGIPDAEYYRLHVLGTRHVLEEAAAGGVRRILVVSSPGVLGPTGGPPQDETAPYAPSNPYERSKAIAEKEALTFVERGLPLVIVRPEFLYGPGDHHVLGLFRAIQSGRFFLIDRGRSFCHPTFIEDGVRGMLLALETGAIGEIYQVAGETSLPMAAFTAAIARTLGRPVPRFLLPRGAAVTAANLFEQIGRLTGLTPPLTRSAVDFFSTSYRFSIEKARRELGYQPQVSLEEGLARTVAWYRENGLLPA